MLNPSRLVRTTVLGQECPEKDEFNAVHVDEVFNPHNVGDAVHSPRYRHVLSFSGHSQKQREEKQNSSVFGPAVSRTGIITRLNLSGEAPCLNGWKAREVRDLDICGVGGHFHMSAGCKLLKMMLSSEMFMPILVMMI